MVWCCPFRRIPRSVIQAELAARAAGARLFPALERFGDRQLRTMLSARGRLHIMGQHGDSDDRHEPYHYGNARQRRCADAIAAIVPASMLQDRGGYWTLAQTEPCGETDSLCKGEPFALQPRFACDPVEPKAWTGSLVHESALLTCWHYHEDIFKEDYMAVFGFVAKGNEFFQPRFAREDVVPITGLIDGNGPPDSKDEDWAILSLKKPVRRRVLEVQQMPPQWWNGCNPAVYSLGHPSDLPMKLVDQAWAALHPDTAARFLAPLDTYPGCSGSPVIAVAKNRRHVVMGIVVGGQEEEVEYEKHPDGCWIRHVYEYTYPELIGQSCAHAWTFLDAVDSLHGR